MKTLTKETDATMVELSKGLCNALGCLDQYIEKNLVCSSESSVPAAAAAIQKVRSNREKRAYKRAPVNMQVEFCCCEKNCTGTIKNFSASSMLISSKDFCIPLQMEFEVLAHLKGESLRVPVKLGRIEIPSQNNNEIVVEIITPTKHYADIVDTIINTST